MMKTLSSLDAAFLYLETPEMPMHVGALHVFELPDTDGSFLRQSARVRAMPQPFKPRPVLQSEADFARACLANVQPSVNNIVRRYREQPSPLVRDSVSGWRTGRLDQVLGGDFDLIS
jgi:ATP-dependent Clp protease ATP-binding subunit ClpC